MTGWEESRETQYSAPWHGAMLLRPWELEIRAGRHAGEVEVMGADIAGIGVHEAAQVLEVASSGEPGASAAMPTLVAGSGFEFDRVSDHALQGVFDTGQLHRAAS